jgi:hypothetical protein
MSTHTTLSLAPGSGWSEMALVAGANRVIVQGQSATTAIVRVAAAKPSDDDGDGMWVRCDNTCKLDLVAGDKLFWRPHPSIPQGEPARINVRTVQRTISVV